MSRSRSFEQTHRCFTSRSAIALTSLVAHIAADANSDSNGQPYFRVIAETEKAYLGDEVGSLPIIPGMQASIDIHTGSKSVLEYLIRPVLKLKHESFRER